MPTFGELLAQYMARTGISDSELARTVGVSRQTVFRWKEGLVARPRHRDDVLAMARRLRLSQDETDLFLAAAGFAPDRVPAPGTAQETPPPGVATSSVPELPAPATGGPAAPAPEPAPRGTVARRRGLVLGGLALVGLAALGLLVARPPAPADPVARPGEQLALVAPVVDQAGRAAPNEALAEALRREIRGHRLAGIRTAPWPRPVTSAAEAAEVLRRSGAAALLWPADRSGAALRLALAPDEATTPTWPAEPVLTSPRLAALVTLSMLLRAGDPSTARTLLVQALPLAPDGGELRPVIQAVLGGE